MRLGFTFPSQVTNHSYNGEHCRWIEQKKKKEEEEKEEEAQFPVERIKGILDWLESKQNVRIKIMMMKMKRNR